MIEGALNPRIQVFDNDGISITLEQVEKETVNSQNLNTLILSYQGMFMFSIGVINECKYFLHASATSTTRTNCCFYFDKEGKINCNSDF